MGVRISPGALCVETEASGLTSGNTGQAVVLPPSRVLAAMVMSTTTAPAVAEMSQARPPGPARRQVAARDPGLRHEASRAGSRLRHATMYHPSEQGTGAPLQPRTGRIRACAGSSPSLSMRCRRSRCYSSTTLAAFLMGPGPLDKACDLIPVNANPARRGETSAVRAKNPVRTPAAAGGDLQDPPPAPPRRWAM